VFFRSTAPPFVSAARPLSLPSFILALSISASQSSHPDKLHFQVKLFDTFNKYDGSKRANVRENVNKHDQFLPLHRHKGEIPRVGEAKENQSFPEFKIRFHPAKILTETSSVNREMWKISEHLLRINRQILRRILANKLAHFHKSQSSVAHGRVTRMSRFSLD